MRPASSSRRMLANEPWSTASSTVAASTSRHPEERQDPPQLAGGIRVEVLVPDHEHRGRHVQRTGPGVVERQQRGEAAGGPLDELPERADLDAPPPAHLVVERHDHVPGVADQQYHPPVAVRALVPFDVARRLPLGVVVVGHEHRRHPGVQLGQVGQLDRVGVVRQAEVALQGPPDHHPQPRAPALRERHQHDVAPPPAVPPEDPPAGHRGQPLAGPRAQVPCEPAVSGLHQPAHVRQTTAVGGSTTNPPSIARRVDGDRGVAEEVGFLGGPERLFACSHLPTGPSRDLGVVVCSPILCDFGANYRREVSLARRLAAAGVPVLRYHPRGTGHSDGARTALTLDSLVADATVVLDRARDQLGVDRLAVLATRFSALAAAEATRGTATPLALWEPVTRPRAYLRAGLRARAVARLAGAGEPEEPDGELARRGWLDVLGIPVGRGLYDTPADRTLAAALAGQDRPLLVVRFEDGNGDLDLGVDADGAGLPVRRVVVVHPRPVRPRRGGGGGDRRLVPGPAVCPRGRPRWETADRWGRRRVSRVPARRDRRPAGRRDRARRAAQRAGGRVPPGGGVAALVRAPPDPGRRRPEAGRPRVPRPPLQLPRHRRERR